MDDLISRQWLMECVNEGWIKFDTEKDENRFIHLVRDMAPSAEEEPCEDAVSREAVSEWLKQYGQDVLHGKYKFSLMYIWKNLTDLPSVQIKRKNGKWIYNSPVTMKCNQCGFVIKDWDWHRFKYCPNCIADMRGENDGRFNQQTVAHGVCE